MPNKEAVLAKCRQLCNERLLNAEKELSALAAASNADTKSSAGDKYETGRAMIAQEKEKIAMQIMDAQKMLMVLSQIKPDKISKKIELGSLIQTEGGSFFISTSLGAIDVQGESVFAISPVAPIGKLLIGLGVGDEFKFNQKSNSIIALS